MNKKAFIFDLDGTLLDSLSNHEAALNKAVEEYIHNPLSEQLREELRGKTSPHKLDILVRQGVIDRISLPWILERKNELSIDYCFGKFKPLFQHIDAMNLINKELNCKIVICSNSSRQFVNKFIDNCGFEHLISFSLSGDDVELKKPYGDIYTKAFRLLNILPDEGIIFEDSEDGVTSAIRSGCHNIVEIKNPIDIGPKLITEIIKKFGIQYYGSKYLVYK